MNAGIIGKRPASDIHGTNHELLMGSLLAWRNHRPIADVLSGTFREETMKTSSLCGALFLSAAIVAVTPVMGQETGAILAVTEDEEHGPILVDGDGMALYLFETDTQGQGDQEAVSSCKDDCAQAWPPLTGTPKAGEGVQGDLVGTIEREDGETQVTYNGWPLYYFVKDQAAGDTSGHDIEGFGGEWYLVTPEGEKAGEH